MSKIHILEGSTNGIYGIVLHFPMPAGNNQAGFPWKDCWVNSGRNVTRLVEGTGPGEISTAEKVSVEAGDVIEFSTSLARDSVGGASSLTAWADQVISDYQNKLQAEFKYFGYTQET